MSDSKTSRGDGDNKSVKRNLPSWMSSREGENRSHGKNPNRDEEETPNKTKTQKEAKSSGKSFSKLMEGVVFVLSGFVNPERGILRSQALEMGAEYKPDWDSDCTLLACAFPNTPKFRQVEAAYGTIVSKDWISECYCQKKLVDIESYLMHAGRPWRKGNVSHEMSEDERPTQVRKLQKQVEDGSPSKGTGSSKPKRKDSSSRKKCFSPSEVKKWAIDDFNRTLAWLESQDEKPVPSEIKNIAVEGILTCLQDAISSLKQNQGIKKMTEEWNFVPHVVEELAKHDEEGAEKASMSKEHLHGQAMNCKSIYEVELKAISSNKSGYDSDETVEMTEEEIDLAFKNVTSKIDNE